MGLDNSEGGVLWASFCTRQGRHAEMVRVAAPTYLATGGAGMTATRRVSLGGLLVLVMGAASLVLPSRASAARRNDCPVWVCDPGLQCGRDPEPPLDLCGEPDLCGSPVCVQQDIHCGNGGAWE